MPVRPTFANLRSSSFPSAIGECLTNFSRIANVANECMERLSMDPLAPDEGWIGGWAKFAFSVQPVLSGSSRYAYFTTPRNVARVILLDVCGTLSKMRNGFFEFLEFSPGLEPKASACGNGVLQSQACACGGSRAVFDRDNVPILGEFPGTPQFIRLYPTNNADIGRRVLVQGNDQNNQAVLATDSLTAKAVSGEYVALAFPFAQTQNQFSALTGLNKETTLGPVQVFAVDPVSRNAVQISSLDPLENAGWYRRYLVTGLPLNCCNTPAGTVTLTTQVRLEFQPIESDPDYLFIPNIPALIQEGFSWRYDRMDNTKALALSQQHHAKALSLLNGQLDLYNGKTKTAIRVPMFGSNPVRLNPV